MVPVATAAPRPSNGDARAGAAARPWGLAPLTAGREAAAAALPASRCAGAAGALRCPPATPAEAATGGRSSQRGLVPSKAASHPDPKGVVLAGAEFLSFFPLADPRFSYFHLASSAAWQRLQLPGQEMRCKERLGVLTFPVL